MHTTRVHHVLTQITLSSAQAEEYLVSLDPVLQRLNNDIPQAGYDRRSLSQLVVQLQQFMEIALGIKVRPGGVSCRECALHRDRVPFL